MRGPTIKRPSEPREAHRQHLRLANYTSFTLDWESPRHGLTKCIFSHLLDFDQMNQFEDIQEHVEGIGAELLEENKLKCHV